MNDYSLVMPFIACEDQGGPYQADAFVAGYTVGYFDGCLGAGRKPDLKTVRTDLVPQLDLVAMRHGRTMHVTECEGMPEYSLVRFAKAKT